MKTISIFCFGFGQVAKSFIKKLIIENYDITLTTTSRKKSSKENFKGVNYNSYLFDSNKFDNDLLVELKKADHILVSIPPEKQGDLVVKNFSKYIEDSKVKWITYLSALLQVKKNLSVQIFRLSGIYSNKKNILVRLKLGTAKLIDKKDHYFSRIHIQDIANILFKSLSKFKSGEIYNLADDKPSSSEDITLYGAKLLNIKNLKKIEVNEIESEMLKNFYKDSKKVSNQKIKNYFGYNFKFPTYVEGLNYIRDNII